MQTATHMPSAPPDASARQADRIMLPLIWVLFITALGLANWYDTWGLALGVGLPLALIPTALIFWLPGQRVTRMAVAVVFMLFCALHIHQAMGTVELHFGIFVLLAVLLCYRDWVVILVAAGVVALHHFSFNTLQELGYPTYCFTQPGLGRVISHAAYVVVESIFLCYIAHWMQRDARQATELTQMVARIARDNRIHLDIQDEAPRSPAATTLHQVLQAIAGAVSKVHGHAVTIDQVLERLRSDNQAVRSGAEHQAGSIGQSVQAIQSLSESLNSDLLHAQAAEQHANQTTALAQEGSQAMAQSVHSMHEMGQLSKRISEITTLIDGIAFQTNILALNASVEAARAGEHGRGFAVVASEVRTLAQRSADASRQIRDLIQASTQQVAEGTILIERSGATMEQLAAGVQTLSQTLKQFLEANRAQAQQVQELERSMEQVQDIADTTLNRAQETEGLVLHLDQGARQLNTAVGLITV
ncbi:methyl-accepting chemotaxis protein [Castellaniella sp.]|uniref:methyl-accepting chemotaxis protein n=1 Tax=Castellaniella sp. TaxID=1955812 RepID=UPI002AFEA2CA|nr:methyl-accepting chemotaxis protein [Castellaniella sp.]